MTHMRHAYEEILCQGAALSSHLYVFSCCFPLLVFLCVSSLSVSLFVFVWAWPAQLNTYQPAVYLPSLPDHPFPSVVTVLRPTFVRFLPSLYSKHWSASASGLPTS